MSASAISEQKARSAPETLSRSVMYQIFLRAFTPEGTLSAAKEKLPRLAELGIDIIYLCPVCLQDDDERTEFWSDRQNASGFGNAKNPYRIKDYFAIDPEYGNKDDLREFVTAAHALKMKVLLDIVFFHCGPGAVFLDEHPDFIKRNEDGSVFHGEWHFPALNFDTPSLRDYLFKNLEYWINEFQVDGYRCDVANLVPLDFWEEARDRLEKINPEITLLSEGEKPEDQRKAFDLSYPYTWSNYVLASVFDKGKPASELRRSWEEIAAKFPQGARFVRYIENHDIVNDSREKRNETAWGFKGIQAALALIFALDGVPFIYNGQEVADAAPHSIYARIPIEWEKENTAAGRERFDFMKTLCALRHHEPVLSDGDVTWIDNGCPDALLTFVRCLGNEQILAAINLSNQPVSTWIKFPSKADSPFARLLEFGSDVTGEDETGRLAIKLDSFGYFIGKR